MEEDDFAVERRRKEAAQWFARLKTLPVSQGTLNDFFAWRRERGNAEAFEEAERFWSDAEKVGSRPSILRAVQEAQARRDRPPPSIWRAMRSWKLASLIVLSTAGVLLAFGVPPVLKSGEVRYETKTGEQQAIALDDGSRLNLNVETAVRVDYTPSARRLVLQDGEALFSVAHNTSRPFIVAAGLTTITATGTRFDVALRDGRTVVTLIEGHVTVRAEDSGIVRMHAGQQWTLVAGKSSLRDIRTEAITAWTQGRVVFDDTPLAEAIAEINRHGGKPVLLDAGELATGAISGSFDAGDSDSFATGVTALLPLRQVVDGQGHIHLEASEPIKNN